VEDSPAGPDVSECVGALIDRAVDLTARFLTDRAELSASAGFTINRVCREGPLRLTTLAAREGITQPSMTQLITRLERQGLVTRLPDPEDGRAALVGITQLGRDLIDDRKRVRRERLAELLATLSPEEANALWLAARVAFPVMERLVTNAETAPDDPAGPTVAPRPANQRKVLG
jgi:DNA-binding MarR family transcriptional regulator